MTVSEIKEILNKGRTLEDELVSLKTAKEKAFNLACNAVSDSGNEKVQVSVENATERKLISYTDYSVAVDKKINELVRYRTKLFNLIYLLDDPAYRTLLVCRYLNCMSWEQVAEFMNYDVRWIHEIHKRALHELYAKIKCGD